jgi:WD40 repeat protein
VYELRVKFRYKNNNNYISHNRTIWSNTDAYMLSQCKNQIIFFRCRFFNRIQVSPKKAFEGTHRRHGNSFSSLTLSGFPFEYDYRPIGERKIMRPHKWIFFVVAIVLTTAKPARCLDDTVWTPSRVYGSYNLVSSAFSTWLIATGSTDGTVTVWDYETRKAVRSLVGHTGAVGTIALSSNEYYIVSGSKDSTAILWDGNTFQKIATIRFDSEVDAAIFTPNNLSIIFATRTGIIKWDIKKRAIEWRYNSNNVWYFHIAISPDDSCIAVGGQHPDAVLLSGATGEKIRELSGNGGEITSLAFSPYNSTILSCGSDTSMVQWDVSTGKVNKKYSAGGKKVVCAVYSPDGNSIFSGSEDNLVRRWNPRTGEVVWTYSGPPTGIVSVAFSLNGLEMYAGSQDHNYHIWDAQKGWNNYNFYGLHDMVTSLAFSPDGRTIVTGSEIGGASLLEVSTGALLKLFPSGVTRSVAYSHDGEKVLTGGGKDSTLSLWNVNTGELIKTLSTRKDRVEAVAFSPDDGKALLAADGNIAYLWDLAADSCLRIFWQSSRILSLAFSPDGNKILTGADTTARIWDANTGKLLKFLSCAEKTVLIVDYSPDGAKVLGGFQDGTVCVWDANLGTIERTFSTGTTMIRSAKFSPDGTKILASDDRGASLWEVATGRQLRVLAGLKRIYSTPNYTSMWDNPVEIIMTANPMTSVAFSPDGAKVLTAEKRDFTLWLWDIADLVAVKSQSPQNGLQNSMVSQIQFLGFNNSVLLFSAQSSTDAPSATSELRIVNPSGATVAIVAPACVSMGGHLVFFTPRSLGNGLYLYQLTNKNTRSVIKDGVFIKVH